MLNWKLKTLGSRPIGLDIGHSSIKMIQLAVNGEQVSILAADKVRIDAGVNGDGRDRRSFIVSAIKQMLAEGNFRGRNVVSCLPNDGLKITSLRLAEAESSEIERALRKEVSQRFGLDPDKDLIEYLVAGNVHQGDEIKNELIVFAVDDGTIRSHIELLEQAGLRLVGIDTVPCALFRGFERSLRRQEDRQRSCVFVDVGSRFTTVVFGRGGQISFIKQIPIGGGNFNHQIAAKLGISVGEAEMLRGKLRMDRDSFYFTGESERPSLSNAESGIYASGQSSMGQGGLDSSTRQVIIDSVSAVAEELAREISLCFRYYTVTFRGERLERAVFTGGEAYEKVLLNVLRRQLAVEIEVAQPLKGFDLSGRDINFDSDRRGLLCEWAVAAGLALKGSSYSVN